ncbi:zinc ribbon domain-containing protein YjdM [Zhongshania marina]|uniref:Alkylphosphonate utilization protein n=1 Tax=Zhongshania marina TaxID=2304603 RepID=A0A2S4HFL8_9GAMM|nr:zinc ribbon domain-containing protein YjdM [Marortus luteolus]POP52783.1 alkylphosphonate utilization protein [Marortus luteolus]
MSTLPPCPKCESSYVYEVQAVLSCPECGFEWNPNEAAATESEFVVKDANGNLLAEGDYVTLIKDLKIKGTSTTAKIGTKVKIGRLVEGDHDIDCNIKGIGPMMLKSEFVKKSQ